LDQIIANFDPSYHEPPVTKDHIQDGPAYGWIEKIWRKGSVLYAKMKDMAKDLIEDIKAGRYKKRSIELWDDFEGTGKLVLKAVTWLGARPPQVKGMTNIFAYGFDAPHGHVSLFTDTKEFTASEEDKSAQKSRSAEYGISIIEGGHVTKPSEWSNVPDDQWGDPVNFAYPCPSADQTQAALKYWGMARNQERYSSKDQEKISESLKTFAKKFKIEEDEMELKEVQKMIDDALVKQKEELIASFSEQLKDLKEENKQLKEKHEKYFSEDALKKKKERIDREVNQLLKDERITPAYIDAGFKKFLMAQREDVKIEFGEGDDKKEIPVIDFAIDLFSNKIKGAPVHFGEIVKREDGTDIQVASFKVMGDGKKDFVDADSFELNDKALKYAKENKVPFKDALCAVSSE